MSNTLKPEFLRNEIFGNTREDEVRADFTRQEVNHFFKHTLPEAGYARREGQFTMARLVTRAITERKSLAVEAGVGIGKTFAYLVPALFFNQYYKQPVIIATSTIALQEQMEADIHRISEMLGMSPEVIVAKGKNNYICRNNAEQEGIWSGKAATRSDLPEKVSDEVWERIRVNKFSYEKCSDCVYFDKCHYFKLRHRMKDTTGIIITNQDLLTAHLMRLEEGKPPVFPFNTGACIVDEAHNLETRVRSVMTLHTSEKEIVSLLKEIQKQDKEKGLLFGEAIIALEMLPDFFTDMQAQINQQELDAKMTGRDAVKFRVSADRSTVARLLNILNALAGDTMKAYNMNRWSVRDPERIKDISEKINEITQIVSAFVDDRNRKKQRIAWAEKDGKAISLYSCPADIASRIRRLYFYQRFPVICTSATLMTGVVLPESNNLIERYSYFLRNIGCSAGLEIYLGRPQRSPFDYVKNLKTYIVKGMPHPTHEHEDYVRKAIDEISGLIRSTEGRTLVLFTSKEDMKHVFKELKKEKMPYTFLMQTDDAGKQKLIEEFTKDTHSVLLATGTFWEGVDVPGESLSSLIIFRLPFATTDPILEDKCKSSLDPMKEIIGPEMAIKLRQGCGRLIRSENDKGIITILDSRALHDNTRPYTELIEDVLPAETSVLSKKELIDFYKSLKFRDRKEDEE